jgi:hypothetical protein
VDAARAQFGNLIPDGIWRAERGDKYLASLTAETARQTPNNACQLFGVAGVDFCPPGGVWNP